MEKYYLHLILNEARNFDKLKNQYNYTDLDDLIGHYIEENVISSKNELIEVLNMIKKKIGIVVKLDIFNDWWVMAK
jgi:hypothetical protein